MSIVDSGKYYLYRHIRLDKNEPFYIGIGSKRNRNYTSHQVEYERAYSKRNRNKFYQHIANKCKVEVEILLESDSLDFIKQKEKEFITIYGFKTKGGYLVNMTKGGEGTVGLEPWNKGLHIWGEQRKHPRLGKVLSEETKRKKSESMKNSPKNLKGKKLPDWWVEKIRQAKFGKDNPMYGKPSHLAKKVIDIETGIIYSSIMESAKSTPYQFQYVSAMLNGTKPNKTNLRFL